MIALFLYGHGCLRTRDHATQQGRSYASFYGLAEWALFSARKINYPLKPGADIKVLSAERVCVVGFRVFPPG
ncbi:hypothetical protein GCM10011402_36180 [Paracoccus acridae]|uniref:Uncharacterized protein n=1 Tax=Paracoccus acridae TaxID=1795310 RepID=A0ABQ1VNP9_9RHOB|nr:hypothetical protein GCM10011402_36180 [Paracoccus acridae]